MFFGQAQEPIGENSETEFLFAEGGEFFGDAELFQQEMARENALNVETRVFDVGHQIIAEHGGIVLHPCFLEVCGFLAEGVVQHEPA